MFRDPEPLGYWICQISSTPGLQSCRNYQRRVCFSRGLPDGVNGVSRDQMLNHIAEIVGAVELPVNADFQSGYAHASQELAKTLSCAFRQESQVCPLKMQQEMRRGRFISCRRPQMDSGSSSSLGPNRIRRAAHGSSRVLPGESSRSLRRVAAETCSLRRGRGGCSLPRA